MSVINQVLKDLERRHASGPELQVLAPIVRPLPAEPAGSRMPWVVAVALAGLLTAAAWIGWQWGRHTGATGTVSTPGAAQAAVDLAASAMAAAAVPTPRLHPAAAAPVALEQAPQGKLQTTALPRTATPAAAAEKPNPPSTLGPARRGGDAARAAVPAAVPKPAPAAAPDTTVSDEPAATATAARPPVDAPGGGAAPEPLAPIPASAEASEASIDKQVRPPTRRERADAEFRRGMTLFQRGHGGDAEVAWRAALAADATHAAARQALLGALLESGRRSEAEVLLDEGIAADPKHVTLALVLARLQLDRGAQDEALATLERSLPFAQWSADYLATTAAVLTRASRHRDAAALYEAALRINPGNAVWTMGLGLSLRADGRKEEARAAFQRARELRTLNAELQAFVAGQLRELQ